MAYNTSIICPTCQAKMTWHDGELKCPYCDWNYWMEGE